MPLVMALTTACAGTPLMAEVAFLNRSAALPERQTYDGEWHHYVGGGVAVMDCNADHLPDLFAAGGAAPSRLFVNNSAAGGDIAFRLGQVPDLEGVTGAYPLDVDGDGLVDLAVLRLGANVLLRGKGDCRFAPAPAEWGFDGGDAWTTAFAATFEPGQDWPTLVFGNYVDPHDPSGPFEACDANVIHRPKGRSFAPPLALKPGFCALSMLISDWKRDGVPELRISNDRQYYVRNGREQMWRLSDLHEYTEDEGWPTLRLWGMGIASRDLTGDGLPEVVLTSMGDQLLQINLGKGQMQNAPYATGSYATTPYMGDDGRPSTGWHAQFGDIDNDGHDDLFIAKGNVEQMPSNAIRDPNNLLIQQADGTFVEMGGVTGVGTMDRSRGAAMVDLNRDGRLDLVVVNRRAPVEIWQNTTKDARHFLMLDPVQGGANHNAVGAIVTVTLPDGRVLTQERTVGGGHASGQMGPLHFGLGAATDAEVRVIWPDGQTSGTVALAANQWLRLSSGLDGTLLTTED
ncbi:MAG: CRTAC1 family protein [Paracoccaceae bacterium]